MSHTQHNEYKHSDVHMPPNPHFADANNTIMLLPASQKVFSSPANTYTETFIIATKHHWVEVSAGCMEEMRSSLKQSQKVTFRNTCHLNLN